MLCYKNPCLYIIPLQKGRFKMNTTIDNFLQCSKCGISDFEFKREATYIYTYDINPVNLSSEIKGTKEVPYLFDNREQVNEKEYLMCKNCGATYPCSINKDKANISLTILRKAIRSDSQENPEFLG